MANNRRRRRRRNNNNEKFLYGVFGASVLILLILLIGVIASGSGKTFSGPKLSFGKKTPGQIVGVKTAGVYETCTTPEEWAMLEEYVPNELPQSVSIMMIGDMLMHLNVTQSGLKDDGTRNYDHLFARIRSDIQAADIAIVNEEIVFAGESAGYSGYPMFNTAEEVGVAEADAGFNVILHATNHTMDKLKAGLMNTINFWKRYPDIHVLGVNETAEQQEQITVIEKNGIKIALLNYTYGLNGMPMPSDMPYAVNLMDEALMDRNIKKAHEEADFVVVLIHWGTEYQTTQSKEQENWAQWFLERDVDLIIGAHPHVIQPIEWLTDPNDGDEMLVYYSLGNYVTGTRANNRIGIYEQAVGGLAKVEITRDAKGEVYISKYGVVPLVANIGETGYQKIYTCPLSEYTNDELNKTILHVNDPGFSIENCEKLCERVWGDLYEKGQRETILTHEHK